MRDGSPAPFVYPMTSPLLTTPGPSHSDEYSDDDPNESLSTQKRSTRACDPCRKSKSKCIKAKDENQPCINCQNAGTQCTYMGPSYKRGPPKGYIHAIEQRLRQVESVLGALLGCSDSRAQGVIADLRTDEFARSILNRVDKGPFGSSTRIASIQKSSLDDPILSNSGQSSRSRKEGRANRDTRLNRELVSTDHDALRSPTVEWQDQLIARIAGNTGSSFNPMYGPSRLASTSSQFSPRPEYLRESSDPQDVDDPVTNSAKALGQLSLDENDQIRFHSEASGIPLLERSSQDSPFDGDKLWRFSMSRNWPVAIENLAGLVKVETIMKDIQLPSLNEQDYLIKLYFKHFHPILPAIHQATFVQDLHESRANPTADEASWKPSKLLLLAVFCVASRYLDKNNSDTEAGQMWEAGCDFLGDARRVLSMIYHESRISTCQALLILGLRECGIGSEEQGWLFIGMAIRMAQDLGLHRAADHWQRNGVDLFSSAQKQERKQIWWSCVIVDKYVSTYLGHPSAISEQQYDTDLPQEEQVIDLFLPTSALSQRRPLDVYPYLMSSMRASASLAVIMGQILEKIYPIKDSSSIQRERDLNALEKVLEHWHLNLPSELAFDPHSRGTRPISAPYIVVLHMQYWCTVLLLYRRFIPRKNRFVKEGSVVSLSSLEGLSWRAFDLCQSAASRVVSAVDFLDETFTLKHTFPQLPGFLLTAGIMHVATLSLRPFDTQATACLHSTLQSLDSIEVTWPGAVKCREMLARTKVNFDQYNLITARGDATHKRAAEAAFGVDLEPQPIHNKDLPTPYPQSTRSHQDGISPFTAQMMNVGVGQQVDGSLYAAGQSNFSRYLGGMPSETNTGERGEHLREKNMPIDGYQWEGNSNSNIF